MTRIFLEQYKLHISIILFLVIFWVIQFFKPSFLYLEGTLRQFGVGYKNKTIFPIWLFSIYLGIICYLFVLVFIKYF